MSNLAIPIYEAMLGRAAKYDDPHNLEWDWTNPHVGKFEKHAINACLDLKVAKERIAELEAAAEEQRVNSRGMEE